MHEVSCLSLLVCETPTCLDHVPTADVQAVCLPAGFVWCRYVKAADKEIIAAIKAKGRLVDNQTFTHSYPFCWRSETPLIYRVSTHDSHLDSSCVSHDTQDCTL